MFSAALVALMCAGVKSIVTAHSAIAMGEVSRLTGTVLCAKSHDTKVTVISFLVVMVVLG